MILTGNLIAVACAALTIWGQIEMIRIDHRARMSADAINRTLRAVDKMNCGFTPLMSPNPSCTALPAIRADMTHEWVWTDPEHGPTDLKEAGYSYFGPSEKVGIHNRWYWAQSSIQAWGVMDLRSYGYGWDNWGAITGADLLLNRSASLIADTIQDPESVYGAGNVPDWGVAGEAAYFQYPHGDLTGPTLAAPYVGEITNGVGVAEVYWVSPNLSASIQIMSGATVGVPTFLAMCPDGTVINEAKMEFTIGGLEVLNNTITDDGAPLGSNVVTQSNPDWEPAGEVGIAVLQARVEQTPEGGGLRWGVIGTATGAMAESGKSFVADVTGCARAILAHRSSGWLGAIAFVPTLSAGWLVNADRDYRGFLAGVRGALPVLTRGEHRDYVPSVVARGVRWTGCNHSNVMWLDWTYPASVRSEAIQQAAWPILAP